MPERWSRASPTAGARRALAVAVLPALTVGMVVWHECGHTAAAWLVGDPSARFHLVLHTAQQRCIGCNLYDPRALSPARNAVVNAAGVLATQLLAWSAAAVWRWRARPRWLPRWLLAEVLFVTVVGDLAFQLVQGLRAGVPSHEPLARRASYTDASAVVSFTSSTSGQPHQLVAVTLLVVVALDVVALAAQLIGTGCRGLPTRAVSRARGSTASRAGGSARGPH